MKKDKKHFVVVQRTVSSFTILNIILAQILMVGVLIFPNTALAARTTTGATLNGASSVTVAPGASITAAVTGTLTSGDDWHSTGWRISTTTGLYTCVNTADYDSNGVYTETFTITAPSTPGVYNAYFRISGSNSNCTSETGSVLTMTGAVTVQLICGNGVINEGEQCELPSTTNNNYCTQTTSECQGTMLGTRDAFGNCNSACGCALDSFTYQCVPGQCGATCDDDSDCGTGKKCIGCECYDCSTTLLSDDFEGGNLSKWSTNWEISASYSVSPTHSVEGDEHDDDLISNGLNVAGASAIALTFKYRVDDIDDDDNVYVQYYDGSGYDDINEIGDDTEDSWLTYSDTIGDSQYFINNFKLKIEGSSIDSSEHLWVDDVLIRKCTAIPTQTCGNGQVEGTEQCDDSNTNNGDGCSSTCTVESGYNCAGSPSVCTPDCSGVGNCNAPTQGTCVAPDTCSCSSGWKGANCNTPDCSSLNNCNGNGDCTGPNTCTCNSLWQGEDCSIPAQTCGNGIQEGTEVCDSIPQSCLYSASDGYLGIQNCNAECSGFDECQQTESCGDGIINGYETCEMGGPQECTTEDSYAGTQNCLDCFNYDPCNPTEFCGDEIVNGLENCDDGADNGQPNFCNVECTGQTPSVCGNGIIEEGEIPEEGEFCDDGLDNNGVYGFCNSMCSGLTEDITGPTVSITSPSPDSYLKGIIPITADASDTESGVARVEFWYTTVETEIGEVAEPPYSIDWDTTTPVSDGIHNLWAVAYDIDGNHTNSIFVPVTVDNTPPTVSVHPFVTNDLMPRVVGNTDDMSASTTFDVVVNEKHYAGFISSAGEWSANVTDELSEGTYDVSVTATDTAGNSGSDGTTDELRIHTTPPDLVSAIVVSPIEIEVTFSEDLEDPPVLVVGDFFVNNGEYQIQSLAENNGVVTLNLDPANPLPVDAAPTVMINPLVPASIKDLAGNEQIAQQSVVASERIPPEIVSIEAISATVIEVTFNEELQNNEEHSPAISDFIVYNGNVELPYQIDNVSYQEKKVTITLVTPIQQGDEPYLKVVGEDQLSTIIDLAGNLFATRSEYDNTVYDRIPPVANISPTIVESSVDEEITFNGAGSSDFFRGIAFYEWDFGDDSEIQDMEIPTVSYSFTQAGIYDVVLTVYDGQKNSASTTAKAIINSADTKPIYQADEGLEIKFNSLPSGAYDLNALKQTEPSGGTSGFSVAGIYYEITSSSLVNGQFSADLTFKYPDADNDGIVDGTSINENNLEVYYWDGSAWTVVPNPVRDTVNNTITVTVDHFTQFGLMQQQPASTPASTSSPRGGGSIITKGVKGEATEEEEKPFEGILEKIAEAIGIPEITGEAPEETTEEGIPSVPLVGEKKVLISPESLLAALGMVIGQSAWKMILVILSLMGLIVIGVKEWKKVRERKKR